MHDEFIIKNTLLPFKQYIEGSYYKGKGMYLGESKGCHKFQRHTHPFYQKLKFGPRYHFEKI